jgi:hypothetical protein
MPTVTDYKAKEACNITTHQMNERSEYFDIFSFFTVIVPEPMLGGSLVTTAWRVLRLRMEGMASRYGG